MDRIASLSSHLTKLNPLQASPSTSHNPQLSSNPTFSITDANVTQDENPPLPSQIDEEVPKGDAFDGTELITLLVPDNRAVRENILEVLKEPQFQPGIDILLWIGHACPLLP